MAQLASALAWGASGWQFKSAHPDKVFMIVSQYTVYYYRTPAGDNPVSKFLDSLSARQQIKVLRMFQYLTEYGLVAILPHTKKLSGTPLWEMRILGKDNIRVVYIVLIQQKVLILHGFVKKSQKTSMKDLHIARNRYEEWKKRG